MSQQQPNGVEWPVTDSKGDRSTTATNVAIFAASTREVDREAAEAMTRDQKAWRHKYDRHVAAHVRASLKNPQAPLVAARAGLAELHKSFQFIREGQTYSVADAMAKFTGTFHTGEIKGTGRPKEFELPYRGRTLRGQEIVDLANDWAARGVLEPDAANSIIGVARNPKWSDFSDKVFVMLGAGAAMGPFLTLMAMGANVVAIDVPVPGVWERLLTVAQSSAGTFTFPLRKPQAECLSAKDLAANAGADLIAQAPEVANWIAGLYPNKQIILGSYVYLDSALFVKVSVAVDAIMAKVLAARKNTALAMLGTPTDVYVIPEAARRAAQANLSLSKLSNVALLPLRLLAPLISVVFKKQMLAPNTSRAVVAEDKSQFFLCEGITVPQGPNYILSKRMQQWRCVLARSQGHIVSFNVAPSTRTVSVMKNRTFAWAYDGMGFFPAVEIFDQETSNPVMTALLLADLNDPASAAHPATPLRNPLELFSRNAIHGGAWRMPYRFNTVGEVAVLIHFIKVLKLPLLLLFFLLVWFITRK